MSFIVSYLFIYLTYYRRHLSLKDILKSLLILGLDYFGMFFFYTIFNFYPFLAKLYIDILIFMSNLLLIRLFIKEED